MLRDGVLVDYEVGVVGIYGDGMILRVRKLLVIFVVLMFWWWLIFLVYMFVFMGFIIYYYFGIKVLKFLEEFL